MRTILLWYFGSSYNSRYARNTRDDRVTKNIWSLLKRIVSEYGWDRGGNVPKIAIKILRFGCSSKLQFWRSKTVVVVVGGNPRSPLQSRTCSDINTITRTTRTYSSNGRGQDFPTHRTDTFLYGCRRETVFGVKMI